MLTQYGGAYVVEALGTPTMLVDSAADLEDEITNRGLPEPHDLARVLALVGGEASLVAGMKGIGRLVETELGIGDDHKPMPDIGGYELKTTLGAGDRPFMSMFGMAPTWILERAEIVGRYGRNGTLRAQKVRGRPSRTSGAFRLERSGEALTLRASGDVGLMEWRLSDLEERVLQKMPRMVKLVGRKLRENDVRIVEGVVFVDVVPDALSALAGTRNMYLNVSIPRRAWKAHYEFFVNTTGLRRLYRTSLSVKPVDPRSPSGRSGHPDTGSPRNA